jgi:hypothetical protein
MTTAAFGGGTEPTPQARARDKKREVTVLLADGTFFPPVHSITAKRSERNDQCLIAKMRS